MFDVSVVIVNYNMKMELERCLSSLLEDLKTSGLNVKISIVDNASTDGSLQFFAEKFPQIERINLGENRGFGSAQNIGLRSFEAKYYFVLNPDTYFFPGSEAIKKMYDFLETEKQIGMVGPKILYPDGSLQLSCYRFPTFWHPLFSRVRVNTRQGKRYQSHMTMKDVEHNEKRPVDWLMGSAMFIRGSDLKKVGYFDEQFWMYYEDSDLCRRFWENNIPVYYFPDAKIEHIHHRRSADVPGFFQAIVKNKLARVHIVSWFKYMWKWRGNYKYYATKL